MNKSKTNKTKGDFLPEFIYLLFSINNSRQQRRTITTYGLRFVNIRSSFYYYFTILFYNKNFLNVNCKKHFLFLKHTRRFVKKHLYKNTQCLFFFVLTLFFLFDEHESYNREHRHHHFQHRCKRDHINFIDVTRGESGGPVGPCQNEDHIFQSFWWNLVPFAGVNRVCQTVEI